MNTDKDYALALQLQEQFNRMNGGTKLNNVTPVKSRPEPTKSNLGSPSWELTDPTPNIHALFLQFDRTFFWGKLSRVVVRWSKRMYSCAGICRYQGRNGFCDIALSEPLLKLRPRKDLVETLLHEMIHAFLFVTNNDRDRDGHGPNFLQHMHRINNAANVNISVYHDFIDEVRLYQTHWWRCNGPCQKMKPYFGMVRRSSNRAPSPSDFWWLKHQHMCGGTFVKIKEPEKKSKSNTKTPKPMKDVTNVTTIKDFFPDKNPSNKKMQGTNISNNSSTILVNPTKTYVGTIKSSITQPSGNLKDKSSIHLSGNNGVDNKLNIDSKKNDVEGIKEIVRNHWAQKYTSTKRPNETDIDCSQPKKMMKIEDHSERATKNIIKIESNDPCCSKTQEKYFQGDERETSEKFSLYYSLPVEMVNDCNNILRDLYGQDFTLDTNNFKVSSISSTKWGKASVIGESCLVECPMCNVTFSKGKINNHIKECLGDEEFTTSILEDSSQVIDLTNEYPKKSKSSLTNKLPASDVVDLTYLDTSKTKLGDISMLSPSKIHLSKLNLDVSMLDEINGATETIESSSDFCNCPVCNKQIHRNDADEHLENCVTNTFMADDDNFNTMENIPDNNNSEKSEDIDESFEYNATGTKFPCPCCFILIEEAQMNDHLDQCLL